MEELSEGFWLALLGLFLGNGSAEPPTEPLSPGSAAPYLVQQMSYADTWSMLFVIERAYELAGISVNDTLVWNEQPFDEIVNWYSPEDETITIASLPLDHEIAPYWDNWSKALTGSRWDWRAFFVDETEAREMARFNQFVLAAHEYGHALTYRFDPDHLGRNDHAINCREYPADRFAAGLLEEFAAEDENFARWRLRYAELAADINAHVGKTERYGEVSFQELESNCAILDVDQPTADKMAPYASAYFVRWQALLGEDLPPLTELYQTYLEPYWRDRLVPGVNLAREVDYVEWIHADFSTPYEDGDSLVQRFPKFTPDGALRIVELISQEDDAGILISVRYGAAAGKQKLIAEKLRVELGAEERYFFEIADVLPLGADRVLIVSADLWDASESLMLFDFRQTEKGWSYDVYSPLPGEQDAQSRLIYAGDGKVYIDLYQFDDAGSGWRRFALDLETLAATPQGPLPDLLYRFVGMLQDGQHVLVSDQDPMVLVSDERGVVYRVAGNGLQGFKDADDPLDVEFATIDASLVMDDRIRILDYDPQAGQYSIRDIVLK